MEGRDAEGPKHLSRVYRKADSYDGEQSLEQLVDSHYKFLKSSTTLDASSTSFKDALCGWKYRKASWVCFFINLFN